MREDGKDGKDGKDGGKKRLTRKRD